MQDEFHMALFDLLRPTLASMNCSLTYSTRRYLQQMESRASAVYSVEFPDSGSPNGRLMGVAVDFDIWTAGPDPALAMTIASTIERATIGVLINTNRQGTVRLMRAARQPVPDEGVDTVRLARVTMRLTGRAFRRL